MPEAIFVHVDSSGLNLAIKEALRFGKRTPEIAVNTAAYFVMRGWVRGVKKVSVGTIDSELGTATVLNKKARGGGFRTAKRTRRFTGGKMGKEVETLPLATLILLARANHAGLKRGFGDGTTSNYNVTTGNRYALQKVPKDLPAATHRMISARHSSGAFLASSGIPVIRLLGAVIDAKYRRGAPPLDQDANNAFGRSRNDKGLAIPAASGQFDVFCIVELLIGVNGGRNSESMNKAMHRVGGPELQRQLDKEAENTFNKVAEWSAKEFETKMKQIGAIA